MAYEDSRAEFSLSGLPQNLNVAGSVRRHQSDNVLADASNAAHDIALALGLSPAAARHPRCAAKPRSTSTGRSSPHPKGKDFVDFDEDLQVADIVNATRIGYRDVQLVKRYSTVGMGPSQGRHSALPTARLVAWATQRNISETGVTTARPPFVAEKLAHVAGRAFDPYRQTPMHARHLQAGAKMMPAGIGSAWLITARPRTATCMQAEALHVRNKVGLIDVSTLGGLDVRGPDAAELLNRMYTFAASQAASGPFALCADDQ